MDDTYIPRIPVIDAAVGRLEGQVLDLYDELIKLNESQVEAIRIVTERFESHHRLLTDLVTDVMELKEKESMLEELKQG
jgi:hypothetical protein